MDEVTSILRVRLKQIHRKDIIIISIIISVTFLVVIFNSYDLFVKEATENLKTKYEIEHLGGDTPDRWPAWLIHDQPLSIKITNPEEASSNQIAIIREAILSEETVAVDSMVRFGNDDSTISYKGWVGALESASTHDTVYRVPTEFKITDSNDSRAEISITLTKQKSTEGYSGYTKSSTANDHILRSAITIYNIDSLTDEQLATITRHEFGHAMGLDHASSSNDLMHDVVKTPSFVSGCDIDEIQHVYNAERNITFKCEFF
jgi:hypothetical protein